MQNNIANICKIILCTTAYFRFSAELNFFGLHCLNSTAVQLVKKLAVKRGKAQVFVVLSLLVKLVRPQLHKLHKLVTGERQEGVKTGR